MGKGRPSDRQRQSFLTIRERLCLSRHADRFALGRNGRHGRLRSPMSPHLGLRCIGSRALGGLGLRSSPLVLEEMRLRAYVLVNGGQSLHTDGTLDGVMTTADSIVPPGCSKVLVPQPECAEFLTCLVPWWRHFALLPRPLRLVPRVKRGFAVSFDMNIKAKLS